MWFTLGGQSTTTTSVAAKFTCETHPAVTKQFVTVCLHSAATMQHRRSVCIAVWLKIYFKVNLSGISDLVGWVSSHLYTLPSVTPPILPDATMHGAGKTVGKLLALSWSLVADHEPLFRNSGSGLCFVESVQPVHTVLRCGLSSGCFLLEV